MKSHGDSTEDVDMRWTNRRSKLLAAAILGMLGMSFMDVATGLPQASAAEQFPANYRRQIAQYLLARNRYVIRDAKITPPYDRYGGLFKGGTIPAVCVAIFRDNPFGIVVRDNHVFTSEKGSIHPIALGMESCSDLSPFVELKAR